MAEAPRTGWRPYVVRILIYGALSVAICLAAVQLWVVRSYRATVADLRGLLDAPNGNPTLDEAESAIHGWVVRPFDREEKMFREDVTIRWQSIIGDYWVRLHATRKSKGVETQKFTGLVTPDDVAPKVEEPKDVVAPPKEGPVGAGAVRGGGTPKKKKLNDD